MKFQYLPLLLALLITRGKSQHKNHQHIQHNQHIHSISNLTLSASGIGCKDSTKYETTSQTYFFMCTGQTPEDQANGKAIIQLILSRGYLPTCRVMQLMLWMASEVRDDKRIPFKDIFVDIGANIGSCSVAMASLGFHVIAVEPVHTHVATIQGSMDVNPSFRIELFHAGISHETKMIQPVFYSGARNWGATILEEVVTEKRLVELPLKTVKQLIGNRDVALMKIDCEGCEWAALKGAKGTLHRIPMLKIELVAKSYTAGNETVGQQHILQYLKTNGFDIFLDIWNDAEYYFGRKPNDIIETDRMFGSSKFKLKSDIDVLFRCAREMLSHEINVNSFTSKSMKGTTDIIAIESNLADKMKMKFLQTNIENKDVVSNNTKL